MTPAQLRAAMLRANPHIAPWRENIGPHSERVRSENSIRADRMSCGWYERGTVHVVPSLCAVPGRGYSWPGAASDRTLTGVYAHELGHLVGNPRGAGHGLVALRDARVSSYEPNPDEAFAETFRVFACNPALLLAGRPRRFDYLTGLGLAPWRGLEDWERNLAPGYGQRHLDMCARWLARRKA